MMQQRTLIVLIILSFTLLQPLCSRGSHLSLGGLGVLLGGACYMHGVLLACYRLLHLHAAEE